MHWTVIVLNFEKYLVKSSYADSGFLALGIHHVHRNTMKENFQSLLTDAWPVI